MPLKYIIVAYCVMFVDPGVGVRILHYKDFTAFHFMLWNLQGVYHTNDTWVIID